MTTKRFTHKEDDWEILNNGKHLAYAHSGYQAEKICDLLNELYAEREIAIEGVIFADKLIEDLGGEEMKNQWRKKFRKRRIKE